MKYKSLVLLCLKFKLIGVILKFFYYNVLKFISKLKL